MKLTLYIEGVSTPPSIGGALGETVGSDFPPKLPLRGVGGHIEGTVGASLSQRDGPVRGCGWGSQAPCDVAGGSQAGLKKPAGTGPVTAVTGLTGPDRFRFRTVGNRPKFKF